MRHRSFKAWLAAELVGSTLRSRRLLSRLVGVALVSALLSTFGVVAFVQPAAAASIQACASFPSDANCTGAIVTTDDVCWRKDATHYSYPLDYFLFDQFGYHFETDLYWSPTCLSNFAVTTFLYVDGILPPPTYTFSNKVRRYVSPNTGLPYVMLAAPWTTVSAFNRDDIGITIFSPLVFSPNNPAQACLRIQSDDQVRCTD